MTKKLKKEKVLIYALYDEQIYDIDYNELMNLSSDREEELKSYCETANYEIINITRELKSSLLTYNFERFLESLYNYSTKYAFGYDYPKINRVILYDIFDLCRNKNQIKALREILDDEGIVLETIKQESLEMFEYEQ
ncbi:MAG: hypothetical protein HFI87_03995 [Bacilli bacterium]|nr:hypothetical protein [Bacilli bacterium]